jgi:alpha-amylase/alpha-mannosidase (GH57 family)
MAQAAKYSGPRLKLGFLWHQHQPFYKNLLTGEYLLPWVRLHGVKDYLDMVEILGPHPQIKQTFNMVPSLLEQLDDYAGGEALDPHLAISSKRADEFNEEDKTQALELLFQSNYDNMIAPVRRYAFLFQDRKRAMTDWSAAEWRDLQTLANLVWIDPLYRAAGRLKELVAKGERYTEDEKQEVLDAQRAIIKRIVPTLKEYQERGQIEVSVSPYFHPIMPLLCDSQSTLVAMPGAQMPKERFRHPEDADRQIKDAIDFYCRLFGRNPVGMWPSEGSVSEEIIPIVFKHGIRWLATDEEILAQSLSVPDRTGDPDSLINSGRLYRGYQFEKDGSKVALFFRDHALSDNIGFVYSGWDPQRAADDFVNKLAAIHKNVLDKRIEDPIVPIILDGENAWEYYRNDGHDFLEALYKKIDDSPWLETVTFGRFLADSPELGQLKKLFPGSWINHNFSVWIGHAEDNHAWDLLSKARDELSDFQNSHPSFDSKRLETAWKEIYIAEGSDWNWWFGPDHVGPNNDEFDRLFRAHLANSYVLTDREPPHELFVPVRSSFIDAHLIKPIDFIRPIIDGKVTHFYEWQQAGHFDCAKAGSTMHKAERLLSGIWFGFDDLNLYFRVDRSATVELGRFQEFEFDFEFYDTVRTEIMIQPKGHTARFNSEKTELIQFAVADVLEISIPLARLSMQSGTRLFVRLTIKENNQILEVWPPGDALIIDLPGPGSIPWLV